MRHVNGVLAGIAVIAAVGLFVVPPSFAADESEQMFVSADKVTLLVAARAGAPAVPGIVLSKGDKVAVVLDKGLWARVQPAGSSTSGWVRTFSLMRADPDHVRRTTQHRETGLSKFGNLVFGSRDSEQYSSAAAARGISALGRVMRNRGEITAEAARYADVVTEYRLPGVSAGPRRAEETRTMVHELLEAGELGDYMKFD